MASRAGRAPTDGHSGAGSLSRKRRATRLGRQEAPFEGETGSRHTSQRCGHTHNELANSGWHTCTADRQHERAQGNGRWDTRHPPVGPRPHPDTEAPDEALTSRELRYKRKGQGTTAGDLSRSQATGSDERSALRAGEPTLCPARFWAAHTRGAWSQGTRRPGQTPRERRPPVTPLPAAAASTQTRRRCSRYDRAKAPPRLGRNAASPHVRPRPSSARPASRSCPTRPGTGALHQPLHQPETRPPGPSAAAHLCPSELGPTTTPRHPLRGAVHPHPFQNTSPASHSVTRLTNHPSLCLLSPTSSPHEDLSCSGHIPGTCVKRRQTASPSPVWSR